MKAKRIWLILLKILAFWRWIRAMPWLWVACKELWCESTPLWFPLLSVGLAILAALFLDQTQGILQALIDPASDDSPTDKALAEAQQWHLLFFLAALGLWTFANYKATRFLHEFNYHSPEYGKRFSEIEGPVGRFFQKLERAAPTIAALGPAVAVGVGFFILGYRYSEAEKLEGKTPFLLLTPCIVVLVLVGLRPWRSDLRLQQKQRREFDAALSKRTRRFIWAFVVFIVGLIVFTALKPEAWSVIGPGATLCIAATVFVIVGSLLIRWGSRWRIPLVFICLLYCIGISPTNDNHSVRISRTAEPRLEIRDETIGIRDALAGWKKRLCLDEPDRKPGQKRPVFIICAEGGGARAAYWAARLLAYLEDTTRQYPKQFVPFSSRVLVISGVSGGSLGAATFSALLDRNPVNGPPTPDVANWFSARTANFLGRDLLSAPLAAAAFIDTSQRFVPFHLFNQRDRAAGLERAWEKAWHESLQSVGEDSAEFFGFEDDFSTLWRNRGFPHDLDGEKRWMPSLFFNGTSVELGGRIIASDCAIPAGDYPGAQDALTLMALRNVGLDPKCGVFRLSTAVNFSSRFPGVSPSGEIPALEGQRAQRIVDGGYYDNSGARTAWDNLVAVYYELLKEPSDVIPWVIIIRAGPESKRDQPTYKPSESDRLGWLPDSIHPEHFMVDILAPARAFWYAWISRSGDSAEALKDGTSLISRRLAGNQNGNNVEDCSQIPVERVDFSPTFSRPDKCNIRPHRDPFVIELNLELDPEKTEPPAQETKKNKEEKKEAQKKKSLIPLGWMLPRSAIRVMDDELNARLAPEASWLEEGPAKRHDDWFKDMQTKPLGRVLALLHRERPGDGSKESVTPCPSPSPTSIVTITPGPTPTPSSTPIATPTPIPTPSPTPTATQVPRPTPTPTFGPTVSPPPSPNPSPIASPTPKGSVCVPRRRVDLRPHR